MLSLLPGDLEASCEEKLALVRRRRISSAEDLLRLCLGYSLCDMSLRQLAAWSTVAGLGELSDVAILKRLRHASEWLGHLVLQMLQKRGVTRQVPGCQVRILDATTIQRPGSKGTDLRLHASFDLAGQRLSALELTDASGGETFKRHRVQAGEIVLGDRGYAHGAGIASILRQQGHVVVRGHWQNLPLKSARGKKVDTIALMSLVGDGEVGDWPVVVEDGRDRFPMRMIVIKKSAPAAECEREEIEKEARRKGRTPDPRSLRAAGYVMVVTDLAETELSATQALELYRFRWQIEMEFKRLKGLHHLDHVRAKDENLARTYVFGKLLGAVIVEEMTEGALAFFPWGFPLSAEAA
ncbi:IS4 family transposase [bacterium]|nr:IS4 family transposase [bacterium]